MIEQLLPIKISKIIDLPIDKVSKIGKVKSFGIPTTHSLFLVGKDGILFLNENGEIIKEILLSKQSAFGVGNAVFIQSYKEIDKIRNVHLIYYCLDDKNQLVSFKHTSETANYYKEYAFRFQYDGFMKIIQVVGENHGHHILSYENHQLKELAFLSKRVINKYKKQTAEIVEVNVQNHIACFVSNEMGDVYMYDYLTKKQKGYFSLSFEGKIGSSFFSKDFSYYIFSSSLNGQLNFYIYDIEEEVCIFTKKNILEKEVSDNEECIAFLLPNHTIEIYDFKSLKLIAKRQFDAKMLNDSVQLYFKDNQHLYVMNSDELFLLSWDEKSIENTKSYWTKFSPILEGFFEKIEKSWHEDDIKEVMNEVKQFDKKRKIITIQNFRKRYREILQGDSFWVN